MSCMLQKDVLFLTRAKANNFNVTVVPVGWITYLNLWRSASHCRLCPVPAMQTFTQYDKLEKFVEFPNAAVVEFDLNYLQFI